MVSPRRSLFWGLSVLVVGTSTHRGSHAWKLRSIPFRNRHTQGASAAEYPLTYYYSSSSSNGPSATSLSSSPWSFGRLANLPFLSNSNKENSQQRKSKQQTLPPLLCLHPVGVGMASWYWERLVKHQQERPTARSIYALNLPGCGSVDWDNVDLHSSGIDQVLADTPLSNIPHVWLDACQALLDQVVRSDGKTSGCQLLVQGGLAPIGIRLAAQNPTKVSSLILTSPPTWKDLVTPIPFQEVESNYRFLTSPVFGTLAFGVLESRWAIRFFSNAFLVEQPCDDQWLDQTLKEARPEVRPPVQAFNAGVCRIESLEKDLEDLKQPILVLQGRADTAQRREGRRAFEDEMANAVLQTLPGKSLLPWESPEETWTTIEQFTADNL